MAFDYRSLPPLKALVAFNAAAEEQSFTQAAQRLFVTQGAISRQVRLLEERLGVTLFIRDNRRVRLTEAGANYHQAISGALSQVASATKLLQQPFHANQITVATTHAVATLWLMSRISQYCQLEEQVDVRLLASDSVMDMRTQDYDCCIGYSLKKPDGGRVTKLFDERIFVVCSPEYLQRNKGLSTADLLATRQLVLDNTDSGWFNWSDWFVGVELEPVIPQHKLTFSHYTMLLQAAQQGQGVALAWDYLVNDYLTSGVLVKATELIMETEAGFYLVTSPEGEQKESVGAFCDWLGEHTNGYL
ncbi:MAG: LysR family transcriptional regulator [Gammaproteobacteria bacterium]|jgi:LysR family glycine cleavage system transcriptional activator|nr:LysR family transcriptional regulator [Gammaproteobacteria bacterium]MDP6165017.1 LysR substrate-binding domain-containing protein [Gammaproteobacteria bacterium]